MSSLLVLLVYETFNNYDYEFMIDLAPVHCNNLKEAHTLSPSLFNNSSNSTIGHSFFHPLISDPTTHTIIQSFIHQ